MHAAKHALLTASAVLLVAVVSTAEQDSVRTIATTTEIMKTMTIPFSEAVFEAASNPPTDDKQWTKARDNALALAESANLLMIGDRVRDSGDWMKMSRAQVDAAEVAMKAAAAKNPEALSNAADALYETCDNCHKKYMPNR